MIKYILLAIVLLLPFAGEGQEYFAFNYEVTCESIDLNSSVWRGEKENTKYLLKDYKKVIELEGDIMTEFGDGTYRIYRTSEFDENHVEVREDVVLIESMLVFTPTAYSNIKELVKPIKDCLLYTSPSPRDQRGSRMPSSA